MSNITEIQKTIIKDFEVFDNWIEKYEYLIDLGKSLPKIKNTYKMRGKSIWTRIM